MVRAPGRGPRQDPRCPAKSGTPSVPQLTGATLGLQLSGSVGTRLSSHPPGDWAHSSPAGHLLCMLQIPNCPRESNKAAADSKSLRYICPSRLWAARAWELRDQVWGQLEESRGSSTHVWVFTHLQTLCRQHQSHAPARFQEFARSSEHTRTCVWLVQVGKQQLSECVYTGHCCRLLQALCHAGLVWTTMPKISSLRLSLLEEQHQTICRALLSLCIGLAMPPAALQENLPWQAALAVPGQTSLLALLELGSSELDVSTSLKHLPAGALPWESAGELGKHLPSDGGGCRGCLFLGKKH